MIFATSGTLPFPRFVQGVDEYAHKSGAHVVIQSACDGNVTPQHCEYYPYVSDINYWIDRAELVIAHCAGGTLCHLIDSQKPAVIVPRRSAYGEHMDDHQWDLKERLAFRLPFVFVDDLEELDVAVGNAIKLVADQNAITKGFPSVRSEMISKLTAIVDEIMS